MTKTSFEHTALNNGETYYYVVSAIGPGGESAKSTEVPRGRCRRLRRHRSA